MSRPLEKDCSLELLKFDCPEGKKVFWHSSAHILGEALERIYGSLLSVGPALEEGFFYDSCSEKYVFISVCAHHLSEASARMTLN